LCFYVALAVGLAWLKGSAKARQWVDSGLRGPTAECPAQMAAPGALRQSLELVLKLDLRGGEAEEGDGHLKMS